MSYHVFFALSTGLKNPILVPQGTLKVCQDHVARVERVLGCEVRLPRVRHGVRLPWAALEVHAVEPKRVRRVEELRFARLRLFAREVQQRVVGVPIEGHAG